MVFVSQTHPLSSSWALDLPDPRSPDAVSWPRKACPSPALCHRHSASISSPRTLSLGQPLI